MAEKKKKTEMKMHFTAKQPFIAATQFKQQLAEMESGDHDYHNSGRLASFRLRDICERVHRRLLPRVRTLDGCDIRLARHQAKPQFRTEFCSCLTGPGGTRLTS